MSPLYSSTNVRKLVSVCLSVASLAAVCPAQTMASDDAAFIRIRLVRAREIKAANIWTVGGTAQSPTLGSGTYHVMAYTYRHMTGNDLNGDASVGGSVGGGGPVEEQEEELVEGGGETEDPPGGGEDPPASDNERYWIAIPGTTMSGSCLQGFLQETGVSPNAFKYIPLVSSLNSVSNLFQYLAGMTASPYNAPAQPGQYPGLRVKILPGQEVTVCYYSPSNWKLPTGFGQVMVAHARDVPDPNNSSIWYTCMQQQEVYYDIKRQDVSGDTAVDSRKGYGQPNREGQFPADPNAELRNINFGDWIFKGGMFVGNMPSNSGDRSGTSRFQLFDGLAFSPSDVVSIPRMTVATVFQAGKPSDSSITGAMTVGIFAPLDNTTSGTSESNTTWANKWEITPRASIPPTGSYEQNKDPWRKFVIGATDAPDLLSVGMTKVYDAPHTVNGNTVYKTTWATPKFEGLCYALNDEQSLVDANFKGWRYFADKEFVAVNGDLLPTSFRDIGPRYWRFFVTAAYEGGSAYSPQFDLGWGGW